MSRDGYKLRDANMALLGFSCYAEYLQSPLWGTIRRRVLATSPMCEGCWVEASRHVHHQSYTLAVLRGEDDSKLVSLCPPCHRLVEYGPQGPRGGKCPFHESRSLCGGLLRVGASNFRDDPGGVSLASLEYAARWRRKRGLT